MPSISIFQAGIGEAADDQSARGLAIAKRFAARPAGDDDIAGTRQWPIWPLIYSVRAVPETSIACV